MKTLKDIPDYEKGKYLIIINDEGAYGSTSWYKIKTKRSSETEILAMYDVNEDANIYFNVKRIHKTILIDLEKGEVV